MIIVTRNDLDAENGLAVAQVLDEAAHTSLAAEVHLSHAIRKGRTQGADSGGRHKRTEGRRRSIMARSH